MRKKRNYSKDYKPDIKYQNIVITRFINYLMKDGKKEVANKIIYKAFDLVAKKTNEDPLTVFEKAMENAAPQVEVVSQRVGGANYQVPREVRAERRFILGARWLIESAKKRKGASMAKLLADEFVAAANNEGETIKKKQNTHRMAEANRAFAHFARR